MGVRTLITQPSTHAGDEIRGWLADAGGFELLQPCATGRDALSTILATEPDLLFVDVRLADVSGFELIESIPQDHFPVVVFTADDPRHAARAFDVGAFDYLTRPCKQERFQSTVKRLRAQLEPDGDRKLHDCMRELLDEVRSQQRAKDVLLVKTRGRGLTLIKTRQIDWIDAARSYVRINAGGEVTVARESIQSLAERLESSRFARIHRSTLVNLDRIVEVVVRDHGDYSIVLGNGQKLNLGRSYREPLLKLLKQPHDALTQ